jgi:hypothetical protein
MSQLGQPRHFCPIERLSALPPKASPEADMAEAEGQPHLCPLSVGTFKFPSAQK